MPYVVNEHLGPSFGAILQDERPRFSTKTAAVAQLRKYVAEDKEEFKRKKKGTLICRGNPWTGNVRLEFGCNLWAAYSIGEV